MMKPEKQNQEIEPTRREKKMSTSFVQIEKAHNVVFTSLGLTLAAAVCDQLERAGVPARLDYSANGYQVLVPVDFSAQSHLLLNGQPSRGEIFFN
jgi:hypothetical protein